MMLLSLLIFVSVGLFVFVFAVVRPVCYWRRHIVLTAAATDGLDWIDGGGGVGGGGTSSNCEREPRYKIYKSSFKNLKFFLATIKLVLLPRYYFGRNLLLLTAS